MLLNGTGTFYTSFLDGLERKKLREKKSEAEPTPTPDQLSYRWRDLTHSFYLPSSNLDRVPTRYCIYQLLFTHGPSTSASILV
jgi:hypothetical protein